MEIIKDGRKFRLKQFVLPLDNFTLQPGNDHGKPFVLKKLRYCPYWQNILSGIFRKIEERIQRREHTGYFDPRSSPHVFAVGFPDKIPEIITCKGRYTFFFDVISNNFLQILVRLKEAEKIRQFFERDDLITFEENVRECPLRTDEVIDDHMNNFVKPLVEFCGWEPVAMDESHVHLILKVVYFGMVKCESAAAAVMQEFALEVTLDIFTKEYFDRQRNICRKDISDGDCPAPACGEPINYLSYDGFCFTF